MLSLLGSVANWNRTSLSTTPKHKIKLFYCNNQFVENCTPSILRKVGESTSIWLSSQGKFLSSWPRTKLTGGKKYKSCRKMWQAKIYIKHKIPLILRHHAICRQIRNIRPFQPVLTRLGRKFFYRVRKCSYEYMM